jgi:hypothetical protein
MFVLMLLPFPSRVVIATILPMIISYKSQNFVNEELVQLLHANNIAAYSSGDCDYLRQFVDSWLVTAESAHPDSNLLNTNIYLLWARITPVRCDFQDPTGVITLCRSIASLQLDSCELWARAAVSNVSSNMDNITEYFAEELGVRVGGIREIVVCDPSDTDPDACAFEANVIFNDNFTVALT